MSSSSDDDAQRVQEIRTRHVAAGDHGDPHCAECSDASYPIWPCDAADLLEVIDAQRAIMDAQASVSEQHRKRVQEVAAERDALASRLAAAEAALREIEDVSCWQPRYLEWKRSAQKVGLCPSSDLAVNEIKHLARQALAALAGSREPATTTISDSGDSSRLSE